MSNVELIQRQHNLLHLHQDDSMAAFDNTGRLLHLELVALKLEGRGHEIIFNAEWLLFQNQPTDHFKALQNLRMQYEPFHSLSQTPLPASRAQIYNMASTLFELTWNLFQSDLLAQPSKAVFVHTFPQ